MWPGPRAGQTIIPHTMRHLRRPLARFRRVLLGALVLAALAATGCQSLGYYAQSVNGHLTLMNAARPVNDWLQDERTPPDLQARLQLAQQLRGFASQALHLPDNASYRRYADLRRRAVVWNVAAAPPDSLTLKSWCFMVVGCVSYRGYFDEAEAQALGRQLAQQGWEVDVYPVPAYSTLGWLNWLGGDPLLSTFIVYGEGDLAGLLFHELAHQQVYVDHDSAFNESYATAVERLGVRQWLATRPAEVREAHARGQRHRREFRALQQRTREALAALYARGGGAPHAAAASAAERGAGPEPDASRRQATASQASALGANRTNESGLAGADRPAPPLTAGDLNQAPGEGENGPLDRAALLARKTQLMQDFAAQYRALQTDWAARGEPDARHDRWVAKANNASFGLQSVYQGWVPAFEALFEGQGCDWPRFHAAVAELARQPRPARDAALSRLAEGAAPAAVRQPALAACRVFGSSVF
ncbi:hypothetical protein CCO03_02235 [Comamonas serinivorans]|uniref:Aminopeptidase n=2 Tax=Comamonas serinivorans TaxID=1082851 RepID=A0A1Y0EK50_9BURK|nr:hypothetical protein CCO03_02235 [Comamonas serinivorans]